MYTYGGNTIPCPRLVRVCSKPPRSGRGVRDEGGEEHCVSSRRLRGEMRLRLNVRAEELRRFVRAKPRVDSERRCPIA